MKTFNLNTLVIFGATLSALTLQSCSKGSSTSSPQSQVLIDGGLTTPTGSGYNSADFNSNGQAVDFVPVSFNVMNSYVGTHPLNDPSGYKVNIKLTQADAPADGSAAPNYFGGEIKIGYYDNSTWFQGTFGAGTGVNSDLSQGNNNGEYESEYNYFYMSGTKKVFTGFFQDQYGGVVLVLEPASGSGDGDLGTYKGSIYFKNFAQSLISQSADRKCWFITAGPYTCTSASVINKSSYASIAGYTKLGTFTGIDLTKVLQ